MIGLLSRATRARCLCNCSLCINTTARLAQRSTHASIAGKLVRPDAFTVFSSTLIFSAAVVDARRKDRKLENWDQLLAATRAEIDAVEADQKRRLERLDTKIIEEDDETDGAKSRRPAWLNHVSWGDMLEWASTKERERKEHGLQGAKGISLDLVKHLSDADLETILMDRRLLIRFYAGPDCASLDLTPATHVYSSKKLRTLEWSLVKLVSKYLHLSSGVAGEPADISEAVLDDLKTSLVGKGMSAADITEDIESCPTRLKQLRHETRQSTLYKEFPSPHVMRYNWSPSERQEELIDFHAKLQEKLYSIPVTKKDGVLTLCRMLLTTRIASDVHTYNLLLIRFCQLRAHAFVLATFESFEECHIRPNEITHATMLRYFALTKNRKAFDLYFQRMNGFKSGLAIADPEKEIDPLVASRYRAFGQTTLKFAELARLNTEVYTCLLKGLIEMSRLDEALWYFRNMVNEGWEPGMELLQVFLKRCLATADLSSGWRIWKKMLSICTPDEPISQEARDSMVALCEKCDKFNLSYWIHQNWATSSDFEDAIALGTEGTATEANDSLIAAASSIGYALHRASRDILTARELSTRFPYLDAVDIERKLEDVQNINPLLRSTLRNTPATVECVYKTMSTVLRLNTLTLAQKYVEERAVLSIDLKTAILDEACIAFNLIQQFADANQAKMSELNERPTLSISYAATADGHVNDSSKPPAPSRGEMLSEIERLDVSIAPSSVLQAYNSFRQGVSDQGSMQQPQPRASKSRSLLNYIIDQPTRSVDLEAG